MKFFGFLVCSLFIALAAAAAVNEKTPETVELSSPVGRVRGSLMTSRLGKKIYAFRGLRFGEPPVGELRFKPPVPVAPWKDVFDATEEGPSCPQIIGKNQSEDCLRLNVYTTKLPSATKSSNAVNPKRPVIVYFHPGAFWVFTAQSFMVGPEYLLDKDVVLVTVNYRLGTLGWISTGDAVAPGNLGLKDQVVALRWVQKNIASFGGDPNSVTITGYSAGGWSVVLHMLSPMTKGLFHRAIAMSGSPISFNPLPTQQYHLAKKEAEIAGCPTDSSANIVKCLKTTSAIELGKSILKFFEWRDNPQLLWTPVVEPEIPGVERYLTAQPVDLIMQGKIHPVPFINGVNKDEFGSSIIPFVEEALAGNATGFQQYNDEWEKYAPITLGYERDTPRSREISRTIRQMYFKDQPINLETADKLADIHRDDIAWSSYRTVNLMSQYSKKPVYKYVFQYQGRYSYAVWPKTKKPFGVSHHDDLLYLLYNKDYPFFGPNDPEITTLERMTSMWENFAKTGEPFPSNNPLFANVAWTPFTVENKKYLEIGNELVMKTNFRGERMKEWDRLFPLPTPGKQCQKTKTKCH